MDDDSLSSEMPASAVARLSIQDYAEIRGVLCPYCRAGLPDTFQSDQRVFKHYIPGTPELFECHAMPLRLARGCVQHAIQNPGHVLVEE